MASSRTDQKIANKIGLNLNKTKLAEECGISDQTVARKLKMGKTVEEIREESARYHLKKEEVDKAHETSDESLFEAQTRNTIALADLKELELAEKRGELVSVTEINAFIATMIIRARDVLTRVGPELRDVLSKTSDPNRVQELIDGEVNRALLSLSTYEGI